MEIECYDSTCNAMKVTFTRTRERGYSVSVEGRDIDAATMDPAPGYDDHLPHDAAHFIVEDELGIHGGVFGQLAAGGTASTFFSPDAKKPRKAKERGARMAKANRDDALFSEHAVWAAQSRWQNAEIVPETEISGTHIQRIITRFQEFADRWSRLPVGGSITLDWAPRTQTKSKRTKKS